VGCLAEGVAAHFEINAGGKTAEVLGLKDLGRIDRQREERKKTF
jgi:hypothetical protein